MIKYSVATQLQFILETITGNLRNRYHKGKLWSLVLTYASTIKEMNEQVWHSHDNSPWQSAYETDDDLTVFSEYELSLLCEASFLDFGDVK